MTPLVKISNLRKMPPNSRGCLYPDEYHILANDLKEAIEIAKADPRFEDGRWRIEIRPVLKVDGINE